MLVALYGGSFNPVHYGHVNVVRQALADLKPDRLIVLPANLSPFKTQSADALETAPWWDRLERVKAAFADLPNVTIDDRELRRGGVSYAIDTVREIAAENPGAEIVFLVGEDSVAGLPRWKDYEALKALCTFRSYPRTAESSTEIRTLFRNAGVTLNTDAKIASVVESGVRRKNGFCPCRLPKNPEFFCPCDEFKAQLRDATYHGPCHCRLYVKP